MPNKRDNCLDIQWSKGHPIKFMEFCSEFVGTLKLFLQEQKKASAIFNSGSVTMGFLVNKSKYTGTQGGYIIPVGHHDQQMRTGSSPKNCKFQAVKTAND